MGVITIEKWIVSLHALTCTSYDKKGNEVLTEQIPGNFTIRNSKKVPMKNIALNNKAATSILIVSFFILLYWNFAHNIDVYKYAVVGALYEMSALLVLAATYILPLFIVILILISKFNLNKKYYIALAVLVLSILLLHTIYS